MTSGERQQQDKREPPPFLRYNGGGSPRPPTGTPNGELWVAYRADKRLTSAVNVAIAVSQPLLVTGDPGTGKSSLSRSIAWELGLGKVLEFHTGSESRARDVLYRYDGLRRFHDAQLVGKVLPDGEKLRVTADATSAHAYVSYEALGEAIVGGVERVVLIDEIDKAPRDFPNDLLDAIEKSRFRVAET